MPLPKKTIQFYNDLIDLVLKTPQNIRFDTLSSFARRRGVSYEWVKHRAEVLAYASHGELKRVPKSIRSDVKKVLEEIQRGTLSPKDAKEASAVFLSRTPLVDMERLNREFLFHDPEVLGMQGRIAERAERTMQKMIKSGVHPIRAYSQIWSLMGRKLNYEIPKALEVVPREKASEVIKDIWHANFLKYQAHFQYEAARLDYMNLLRGYLNKPQSLPITLPAYMRRRGMEKDADKFWQRLESDLKNVQRFPRPGRERPFPKDVKQTAIEMYKEHGTRDLSIAKDPFERKLLKIGRNLSAADKIWAQAKELEEEKVSPFVRISRKRRK